MRIVIDLQSCQSGSRLGGIGRYSAELAKAMARNARGHELWLVMNNLINAPAEEVRCAFSDLIPQDRIKIFDVPQGIAEFRNNKTKVRAAEIIRESFISALKPDMVHVSSLFEGLHEEIITSVGAFFPSNRTAVTLYDLIPLVQREKYLANHEALQHYLGKIENLKTSGLLLSISEYSRNEAIDLLDLDPERIINISSAADERFRPTTVDKSKAIELRKKYNINQNFLMYTGSFDQRKNHANLIQAFGMVPSSARQGHQLLIVGNGWDAIYQQLGAVAKKAGLKEDEVIFAGHVADEDLLPLYNLCELFVFPSLAEGFGLPALEAMSCGTATIGSNCTSLPEVIGWSDAEFDPLKPESIAKTITRVLSDKNFKEKLRAHGLKQAKKFSWDESARKAIEGFEKQLERSRRSALKATPLFSPKRPIEELAKLPGIDSLPNEALQEMSRCIGLNENQTSVLSAVSQGQKSSLRVGWVSTWNTQCGIAAYSNFLIEHIKASVIVFAPETDWTLEVDGVNVKRCWKAGQVDDLAQLHSAIRTADIEVLIIQFNYGFFDFVAFNSLLQKLKADSIRVFITFHSTNDPSESKRLSNLVSGLSGCDGLFVHSAKDFYQLQKLGMTHNTRFLPQGMVEKNPGKGLVVRAPAGSTVIATYGFALPHKGLTEVLEAFAILTRDTSQPYHLLMVNAEYPATVSLGLLSQIRERIVQLGVSDQVSLISDYLTDEQSLAHLATANLVVYAYQNTGESSSAAVRMGIASTSPVIVTPIAIFDDVKTSVFYLPGFKAEEIAAGLKKALILINEGAPEAVKIGANAKIWRYTHRFSSVAAYLFGLAIKPKSARIECQLMPEFTLSSESGIITYAAAALPLKTNVGESKAGSFHTTGQAGHLLYGPFISAAAGSYYATVKGKVGLSGVGNAKADVAIRSGGHVLTECKITSPIEGDVLSTLIFNVPDGGCADLEVRVVVDEHSDFSISSVIFERQNTPVKLHATI